VTIPNQVTEVTIHMVQVDRPRKEIRANQTVPPRKDIDRTIDWERHARVTRQPYNPKENIETYVLLHSQDKLSNGGNILENVRWHQLKQALEKRFQPQWESFDDIEEVRNAWQWVCDGMPWTTAWPDTGPPITKWERAQAKVWTNRMHHRIKAHQKCQEDKQWHRETTKQGEEKQCAKYAHWAEEIESRPELAWQGEAREQLQQEEDKPNQPNNFEAWRWKTTLRRLEERQAMETASGKEEQQLQQFWKAAIHRRTFVGGHGVYQAVTAWEQDTHQQWAKQFAKVASQGRVYKFHQWNRMTHRRPMDLIWYSPMAVIE